MDQKKIDFIKSFHLESPDGENDIDQMTIDSGIGNIYEFVEMFDSLDNVFIKRYPDQKTLGYAFVEEFSDFDSWDKFSNEIFDNSKFIHESITGEIRIYNHPILGDVIFVNTDNEGFVVIDN